MSIIETDWWKGAETAFEGEWGSFEGYEGYGTHSEFGAIHSAPQGTACYYPEDGGFQFYPEHEGWADYSVDALSDDDGTIQGFQLTYMPTPYQGLYFAVFLDWKDLTYDAGATGIEAARAYAEALDNARTRLDSLLVDFARGLAPTG